MNKQHAPGYFLLALLLLFTGTFAFHGNLLGKTASTALITTSTSTSERASAEAAASEVAALGAKAEVAKLMDEIRKNPRRLPALPVEKIDTETLWLARCIYSETKRPEEMELIAWVVRNRVETRYRDRRSYRDVVLDPYQFSAFNPDSRMRRHYTALTPASKASGWQRALTIAYSVRSADTTYRPFPPRTRHFYSERSMVGRQHPEWASGLKPVDPDVAFQLDARRFRFFEGVY